MRGSLICLMISFLMVFDAFAFEICGDLKQGELLLIKSKDKTYLKAIERDAQSINVEGITFDIKKTKWDIQSIKGVAGHKVIPSKKHEKEIAHEQNDVKNALKQNDNLLDDWKNGFIMPVEGRISGHFGYQRIFNGIKKNPHSGTDIAAPFNTPVQAAGNGVVVLAGFDYFYTGNMVILDHGGDLKTIYAHLNDIYVRQGERVKKGDVIASVGKSGRATGPHLHWGAVLNGVRFRPHALLDIHDKKCRSY